MRWVSDEPQPGVIEVTLLDADGRLWTIVDKTARFTTDDRLTPDSMYPIDLGVECTVLEARDDSVLISIADPNGLETTQGTTKLRVTQQDILS
jgi:hypothetical protein